ncbi:MAG: hypothetical protein ABIJ81_01210, partial [Patescibacteria group bacterium]
LAGSGIQLYLQNGEWPLLTLGDKVSAAGTVSKTKSYGTRVLIKQGTDIKVISASMPPQPVILELEELSDDYEGWLINITGQVTRKDSKSLTLLKGEKTLKVNFKHDGPWPQVPLQTEVSVTGFLVINNGEFRLWPRTQEDIYFDRPEAGEVAGVSDITIETTNSSLLGYIFIGLALLIIVAGWWWEKKGWPKPIELWQKLWHK